MVRQQIAWALNKGIKAELKQFWDVELGVTYVPWSKVREEQLEELKEGGILDGDTLAPGSTQMPLKYTLLSTCVSEASLFVSLAEWSAVKKALENPQELTHNGGAESQQPEDAHVLTPLHPTQVIRLSHDFGSKICRRFLFNGGRFFCFCFFFRFRRCSA